MKAIGQLAGEELLRHGLALQQQTQEKAEANEFAPQFKDEAVCRWCGGLLPRRSAPVTDFGLEHHPKAQGGMMSWFTACENPPCVERQRELDDRLSRSSDRDRQANYREALRRAGMSARNMDGLVFHHFDTEWPLQTQHREALRQMLDKVQAWARDPCDVALLSGPYGTGKTRLAVAAAKQYLWDGGRGAFYFACAEAWAATKALWDAKPGEVVQYRELPITAGDLISRSQRTGLLVVDDIDKIKPTRGWLDMLLSIFNYRVDVRSPMIVTMNTPILQLEAYFKTGGADDVAAALWDRLQMRSVVVIQLPADMASYRGVVSKQAREDYLRKDIDG